MRATTPGSTNPWGNTIDDGWKDLVVSSAPPPPPREAVEPVVRNRVLPDDFNTWQEHGAPRVAPVEAPVEEPSFSAGDRRLWLVAGTLMGLATLVLGVLGMLTFGGLTASAPAAPAPAVEASRAAPVEPAHPAAPATHAAPTVTTRSANPRILKAASHSSRGRHHKRLATR
ncbi:MAG TPA: hypothetical protein VF997_24545 [Polyangia bacterium]